MSGNTEDFVSGCWRSIYRYEGLGSTHNGNEFIVHASFDAGTQDYFSGIRALICCKDVQTGLLHDLVVRDNVNSSSIFRTPRAEAENPRILEEQQNGRRLAERWRQGDTALNSALPLFTLVFEIVDTSDDTWSAMQLVLLPQSNEQPLGLRVLYECLKPCTPPFESRSLILFLAANRSFRGVLKRDNPGRITCVYPAPMGISTHGVHILPPQSSRKPFVHPPPELLYKIFECAVEANKKAHVKWRGDLISFALVCRRWYPALNLLFRDLSVGVGINIPDAFGVARAIEANPTLGKGIRKFTQGYSRRLNIGDKHDEEKLRFSMAILTILRSATFVKELHIHDTHVTLAEDFVRALCSFTDVQRLSVTGVAPIADEKRYILNVTDILRCLTKWPRLRTATISDFAPSSVIDETLIPTCPLEELVLWNGSILDIQLIYLTSSSHATLREVSIKEVSGLTNQGLRDWLSGVGPTLKTLRFQESPVSRQTDDEEYAVEAVLPIMVNLNRLELEGDVASELVLMRKPTTGLRVPNAGVWRSSLSIANATGVNPHGLVNAMKVTKWMMVRAPGVILEGNEQLKEEARAIANERNIYLAV